MNIKEEIIQLKNLITLHEKRLATLEQQLLESELTFEMAPELLEKTDVDWYEAVKYCKLLGNGWRLPTKDELRTIYKSDNDLNEDCRYWTSNEGNIDTAWYCTRCSQFTTGKGFSSNEYRVRPVRDKVKLTLSFEVAHKSTEINTDWDSAVKYCKTLGHGWRLPTKDELILIYNSENDFDKAGYYWSSTEIDPYFVASVSMKSGWVEWEDDKRQRRIRVRAVRDI